MKANELISLLKSGALKKYDKMYKNIELQTERYIKTINEFCDIYGKDRDIYLFSVPGRSEIAGNHTDHNHGCVLAGAIDRDIIAVAAKSNENVVRVRSEGYAEDRVDLSLCDSNKNFKKFNSRALIAGVCGGFLKDSYKVGGFDAYTTTHVLKGSGLSSSAAFEVMVGNIMNHFYNDGKIPNEELAKIAQYSENEYFGKPCGLMDQMACAVGGFVYIDFNDPKNPVVDPIEFSLDDAGYSLCIVNTKGNHADLNADYASVPDEMKKVAAFFSQNVLRGITEAQVVENAPILRKVTSDRAILRAIHFIRENDRVQKIASALKDENVKAFLDGILDSGDSSFKYLQNVYTTINPSEQGLSLALCVTDGALSGKNCAWRVHGGGFAGTIQAFVKNEYAADYVALIDSVFGEGSCMMLNIRQNGAIQVTL